MPASGRFLLDTNFVILFLKGDDAASRKIADSSKVFIPIIAVGELLFGAEKSGRPVENRRTIEEFLTKIPVLTCDMDSAREYGRVKHLLKLAGKPIPENDVWIAAIAVRWGLSLLTVDRHFQYVEGLAIE